MDDVQISEKQKYFFNSSDKKINIAAGAVRSGKTFIMTLRWIRYILEGAKGDLMMCGKTIRTLERNVLMCDNGLFDIIGTGKFNYNRSTGELNILGRRIYCIGANDEKAESKIRGMTLAGALCDEVTLYPQSFVKQLLARCSVKNAKLFWNCNPDSPYHYIKTDFMDNEKLKDIVNIYHFDMDDNPALDEQYKADLRAMYTGIWFQRMILGQWVLADGVIYPDFDELKHCIEFDAVPLCQRYYVGCDYGITNPHVYLLCGINFINGQPHIYIIKEYYNTAKDGSKTDQKFFEDYKSFIDGYNVESVIIDPSATSLINLFKFNNVIVKPANNDVLPGINNVSTRLNLGQLHIVKKNCPNLLKEFASYVWDEKASKNGEDRPVKESDHALDAIRYICSTLLPIKSTRSPFNVRGI